MQKKFEEHIRANFPFFKDKKLLVAISGGIDSVALTHLLYKAKCKIELAHCNFGLRGKEANQDEQFVLKLAQELGVRAFSKRFNTNKIATKEKLSVQMAARKLRYDWFHKLLQDNDLDYMITAHHLDDDLETFLINFSRGTGLEGLTGIPALNKKIARPLLVFSREEIEQYAQENNYTWREDATNAEAKYIRNKIRHQIIPLLKELNPSLLSSFLRTRNHLQGTQQIVEDTILKIRKEIISVDDDNVIRINIQKLKEVSNSKAYVYEILKEYGFTEWDDLTELLNAQSGKQIYSKDYRLLKDRDHFLLVKLPVANQKREYKIKKGQSKLQTEEFTLLISEERNANLDIQNKWKDFILVDAEKVQFPLLVRKWKEGDYFYPFGMIGKKKLSKFFKDEKRSLIDKENMWLLCSKNDIVWVINNRADDRFKVTPNTKKTLKIVWIKR